MKMICVMVDYRNMLNQMFNKQVELQERLGNDVGSQGFKTEQVLAAIVELSEAIQETPWKSWKKNAKLDCVAYREEIIDVWHFLINISLSAGMGPIDVCYEFMKKNKVNFKRQEDGY